MQLFNFQKLFSCHKMSETNNNQQKQPALTIKSNLPPSEQNSNLVTEFKHSLQNIWAPLISNNHYLPAASNWDETKAFQNDATQRFLELGRQLEAVFVQKRILVSSQESLLENEIEELKLESLRQDVIIEQIHEKSLQYLRKIESVVDLRNVAAQNAP